MSQPPVKKGQKKPASAAERKHKTESNTVSFLSILLLALALAFYGNTLFNGYALDDGLVLSDNNLVKKGFSGIGGIISHDSFYGAIGDASTLNGGRWRPLSLISFAIEYQLFGASPWVSHLINVLLYGLTAIVLMNFLRKYVFKFVVMREREGLWLSFFAAVLFVVHPVHTEAVANIKSRDEIFSLLFLILTLDYCLKWSVEAGWSSLIKALLCFFLALLSKENGLTFLFVIPLSLYFFSSSDGKNLKPGLKRILSLTAPFFVVVVLYALLRYLMIGFSTKQPSELWDNPYMMATAGEKFATIFFVFLYYFKLLIYPDALTYDYSYNQIPYHHFSDVSVIVSLLIHLALGVYVFRNWKKNGVMVWCILFYLASIFIVSNLVLNIGAPLAERFLYQASVGFCVVVVILLYKLLNSVAKENAVLKKQLAILICVVVIAPSFAKTISRNGDWKNNTTLFIHDAGVSLNSARAATFAANRYTEESDTVKDAAKKREYLAEAIKLCYRSDEISPHSARNYIEWGSAYLRIDSLERSEWAWSEIRKLDPKNSLLASADKYIAEKYFIRGLNEKTKTNEENYRQKAMDLFLKAVKYDSLQAEYFYNIGVTYGEMGDVPQALAAYEKAVTVNSRFAKAYNNMGVVYFLNQEYDKAAVYFEKTIAADSTYSDAYANLGSIYQTKGRSKEAIPMYEKALLLNPGNQNARGNLSNLYRVLGDTERANYYKNAVLK